MDTLEILFLFFSLFVVGMLFWSFSSVLISRWKSGETGICTGRSACPHCKHTLSAFELFPIFSFLWQRWKCRHCGIKIPVLYPVLEGLMGMVFVLMGYISISVFHLPVLSVAFFFLLFLWFLTVIYIVYDILFLEIPDEIFILFIIWNFILFILYYFFDIKNLYFNINKNHTFHTYIKDAFSGAIILYTFLYVQIFISGALFFIKKQQYKEIFGLIWWYFLFPFMAIWDFCKRKMWISVVEKGTEEDAPLWVWPWDLFLAIIIGWTLGVMHGIIAFFFAYVLGSVIGVFLLLFSHSTSTRKRMEMPFWPFLGMGFFLSLIFYEQINNFVNTYFLF